jgi:hypothetical protein
LRLGQRGPGGLQGGLVLGLLDEEERLALLHVHAFLEQHLLEDAGDARADFHRRHGFGAGDEITYDRDLALLDRRHHDLGRRGRCRGFGTLVALAPGRRDQ